MKNEFTESGLFWHFSANLSSLKNIYTGILCLVVGLTFGAPKAFAHTVGPQSISVSQSQSALKQAHQSYYLGAKVFAAKFGWLLVDAAQSLLKQDGKTTIIIALGGAEHLGTLLEIGFRMKGLSDRVEFKYIHLSRDVVKPWRAISIQDPHTIKVGAGSLPTGFYLEEGETNTSNLNNLYKQLNNANVFNENDILVVDTGHQGSIAEAIYAAALHKKLDPTMNGLLFNHAKDVKIKHSIPFYAVNFALPEIAQDIFYWAYKLDENIYFGSGEGLDKFNGKGIFQRSRPLKDMSEIELYNYKATLIGLYEGLSESMRSCEDALVTNEASKARFLVK